MKYDERSMCVVVTNLVLLALLWRSGHIHDRGTEEIL